VRISVLTVTVKSQMQKCINQIAKKKRDYLTKVDQRHPPGVLRPEFTVPKLGDDVVFQYDAKLVDDISLVGGFALVVPILPSLSL